MKIGPLLLHHNKSQFINSLCFVKIKKKFHARIIHKNESQVLKLKKISIFKAKNTIKFSKIMAKGFVFALLQSNPFFFS